MIRRYKGIRLEPGVMVDRGLVYVRIFPNGKRFQQCFGKADVLDNIRNANEKAIDYVQARKKGELGLEQQTKRILFSDAVELFLSKHGKTWTHHLHPISKFLGPIFLDELTATKLEKYRAWRTGHTRKVRGQLKPLQHSTVNRDLTGLSSMLSTLQFLMDEKEIAPIKLPERPPVKVLRKRQGWYDETQNRGKIALKRTEIRHFLSLCSPRLKRAVVGALVTGLRRKDQMALTKSHSIEYNNSITGLQSKVNSVYTLPSSNVMEGLIHTADGDVVFDDTHLRGEFESTRDRFIQQGGRYFDWRALRRTAAWLLWEKKHDILKVKDFLGHKDVKTTQLYLGLTSENLRDVGDIMDAEFSDVVEDRKPGDNGSDEAIGFKP